MIHKKIVLVLLLVVSVLSVCFSAKRETTTKKYNVNANNDVLCINSEVTNDCIRLSLQCKHKKSIPDYAHVNLSSITVEPTVTNLTITGAKGSIIIAGDFQENAIYSVSIPKDLESANGLKPIHDIFIQEKIPEKKIPNDIAFLSSGTLFPLYAENFSLPFHVSGMKSYKVTMWRVFENLALLDSWYQLRYDSKELIKEKTYQAEKGNPEYVNLNLLDFMDARKPGIYFVKIDGVSKKPREWWEEYQDSVMFIVTDIAATQQVTEDANGMKVKVFAHYISTGKNIELADVTLISQKKQVLTKGIMNNGYLELSVDPADLKKYGSLMKIIVHTQNDQTMILPDSRDCCLETNDNETKCHKDGCNAFVYAERDIYRPGEMVHAAAFVRQDEKPLTGIPVKFQIIKGTKVLHEENTVSGKEGFSSADLKLPENMRSGNCQIRCVAGQDAIGHFSFLVSDFVPNRIKVSLTPDKKEFVVAEDVSFQLDANYYFGQPMQKGAAYMQILYNAPYFPKHWKGWNVGTYPQKNKFDVLASIKWSDNLPTEYELKNGSWENSFFLPVSLYAQYKVTESGGRPSDALEELTYYPTLEYIGLRKKENCPILTLEQKILGITEDAKDLSPHEVNFSLFREEYDYVLCYDNQKRIVREWKKIEIPVSGFPQNRQISSDVSEFVLANLEPGSYVLRAKQENLYSEFSFLQNYGEAGVRMRDPGKLVFKTDKNIYNPGDVAKISVETNDNDAFAYVMYGEYREEKAFQVSGVKDGKLTFEVPIRKDVSTENWSGTVSLISGKGKNLKRSFGFFRLKVNQESHRLTADIDLPDVVVPGETINTKITLRNAAGNPCTGLVHVFAVDCGILDLTDYHVPDLFKFQYSPYTWETNIYDIYNELFPDLRLLPDGTIGGGEQGDAMQKKLEEIKKKKSAIVYLKPVYVSESGEAEIQVPFPDHTGAMRIMAIAQSGSDFGKMEKDVILRDAGNVMINVPQAVNPLDEFQASFTVFNNSLPETQNITVSVQAANMENISFSSDPFTLERGKSKKIMVYCRAGQTPGSADFTVTVKSGNYKRTYSEPITVRTGSISITESFIYKIPSETKEFFKIDERIWTKADARLEIFPNQWKVLEESINYLNKYPYGCSEQITSCAFPFIYGKELVKAGILDSRVLPGLEDKIKFTQEKLYAMQLYGGGFPMWQGEINDWPESSLYVIMFLAKAEERGILSIPSNVKQAILKWAEQNASRLVKNGQKDNRIDLAWNAYVLAMLKDDSFVRISRNLLQTNDKDFCAAIASLALIQGGYAEEGKKSLLYAMANGAQDEPKNMFPGSSSVAGTGMLLALLMENAPDTEEIPLLANSIYQTRNMDGTGWGDTQSNAWALMGLAAYCAEKIPGQNQEVSVQVQKNNEKIIVSQQDLSLSMKGSDTYSIKNPGKAPLYVNFVVTGFPSNIQKYVRNRAKLKREYLDENGNPIHEAKQGDLVYIRISFKDIGECESVVLCDILPGGLELENDSLAIRKNANPVFAGNFHNQFTEKRTDRFLAFGYLENDYDKSEIVYTARAVTPGKFNGTFCTLEDMYNPSSKDIFGDSEIFEVK